MANYSSTQLSLHGSTENIIRAKKFIKTFITDNYLYTDDIRPYDTISYRSGFGSATIEHDSSTEDSIMYYMSGRWCSPHMFIYLVASVFKLSGIYTDEESGGNFFHVMEFEDGVKTLDDESGYFSDLSIKYNGIDKYFECYEWITEEDDWKDNYSDIISIFDRNGIGIDELENKLC